MQTWECSPGKEFAWNLLSLFTTSGMLFLEVSLLAFLFQGNSTSGLEALTRTFGISGIIVGFDILLKVILWFFLQACCLSLYGFQCINCSSFTFSLLGYISVCIWDSNLHQQRLPYSSCEVELVGHSQAVAYPCLWFHIVYLSF